MVKEIIMPKLGETMEEGVIGKWLKEEGDSVAKGDPLVEVITDKANFEVEAPVAGVLRKIVIPAGDASVPVKQIIGFIASSMDEEMPAAAPVVAPAAGRPAPAAAAGPVAGATHRTVSGAASPRARKLAADRGVDLCTISGTGPGGRIVEKDVLGAAGSAGGAPADGQALVGIRKVIAERMGASKREAPHFYLSVDVDMTWCSGNRPAGVSLNDMIIKAAAKAVAEFPRVNALFEHERLNLKKEVDVAVAVSLEDGLVAPVVRGAGAKSLNEISAVMAGFKAKAKTGKFSPEDLAGGTFTISNLGMLGVDSFIAIINPPQVMILAVGTIKDRATVVAGRVEVRKIMTATGSFDHRAVDGVYGARVLARFKEILERDHGGL